jgi:hypothetical protein
MAAGARQTGKKNRDLQARERAMSDTETPAEDFAAMDDPTFLTERRRVREAIEELTGRLAELDSEFIRRAGIAWASAS